MTKTYIHDPLVMAERMRTVSIPDHVIEDLMGVTLPAPMIIADDDDTDDDMGVEADEEDPIYV